MINKGMVFVIKAICVTSLCLVCCCSGSQDKSKRSKSSEIPLETYIQMNKKMIADEQNIIEKYVADKGVTMKRTETGLWFNISEIGEGENINKGKIVKLNYSISLLNGSLLYSSDESGAKEFLVGQGGVETGLEEGILMLKKGSKASFIMPPHLAHGLIGDDDKIPSRAILLYDVEIIDVKNK